MNDELLTQQLKETGNLMDLLNDDAFLREAAAIETECGGAVEAGLGLKNYVAQLNAASPDSFKRQRRQVQILSILLPELRQWLSNWQLGLSFEAVYTEAQRLVYEHLNDFMLEQQDWLDALLIENAEGLPMEARSVRAQSVEKLSTLLTKDDWQALASVAAQGMAEGVLQMAQLEALPPIAV